MIKNILYHLLEGSELDQNKILFSSSYNVKEKQNILNYTERSLI